MARGRPPKEPDELLTDRVNFALMPEEKAIYEVAASEAGIKLSAWIRDRLTKAANREKKASSRSKPSLKKPEQ